MTEPLKIEVKGSPLTCGEYDENIDRLLDRANHVGTQPCDTISDLEQCIAELDLILGILSDIAALEESINGITNRLNDIENVEQYINALRNELLVLINGLRTDVNNLSPALDKVNSLLLSLQAQIKAIQEQTEALISSTNTSLADIYRRLAQITTTLQQQTGQINTLFSAVSVETTNRINADNNILGLVNNEAANRVTAVSNLQNNLNVEIQARANGDNHLTSLINAEANNRHNGDINLGNLIDSRAPKNSPVFVGQPANFAAGAITIGPPLSAGGVEVINAGWYHAVTGVHINNLNASINTKAPSLNPTFAGHVQVNGTLTATGNITTNSQLHTASSIFCAANFHGAGAFVDNVSPGNRNNVPNMGYLQDNLALKANVHNSTFTGTMFNHGDAHFVQGAYVNIFDPNANSSQVPNANWVNNRLNNYAPISNPSLYGVVSMHAITDFYGKANIHAGGIVATPDFAANGVEIPNTHWVNVKINQANSGKVAAFASINREIYNQDTRPWYTASSVPFATRRVMSNVSAIEQISNRIKFWIAVSAINLAAIDQYSIFFYNSDFSADTSGGSNAVISTLLYKVNTSENTLEFEWGGFYASLMILKK